jgi:hypothetical protein
MLFSISGYNESISGYQHQDLIPTFNHNILNPIQKFVANIFPLLLMTIFFHISKIQEKEEKFTILTL